MAASARLNGGQPSGSLMKSVTLPSRARSMTLPIAPPVRIPVGSHIHGDERWPAKYTCRPASASAMMIVTHTWLPGRKPNATPLLRVFTRSTPGSSLRSSPAGIECSTARLLSWSASTTAASTTSARVPAPRKSVKRRFAASHSRTPADLAPALPARSRPGTERRSRAFSLAVNDPVDDDAVDDLQCEDRQQGAEVDPAECWQHAPEDAQERFADIAQEPDHVIQRARVRRADSDREQQLDDDVEKDEQRVDIQKRR